MNTHDFGPVTGNYQVRCKKCGFEQYSAGPQPVIGCVSDTDLDLAGSFVLLEVQFILKRLAERSVRFEELWKKKS